MGTKILATEIKTNHVIEWNKRLWKVVKYYHVHVGGRGGAYMQVEMKDIENGTKVNQRFRTDEKIDKAFVETKELEFLYKDGSEYICMDNTSFEQIIISGELLESQAGYLLPNTTIQIQLHNERAIGVQFPQTVTLTIAETDPVIKGSTITSSFKPATLETGLIVQVPSFIESGTKIKVNTDTCEYVERA